METWNCFLCEGVNGAGGKGRPQDGEGEDWGSVWACYTWGIQRGAGESQRKQVLEENTRIVLVEDGATQKNLS